MLRLCATSMTGSNTYALPSINARSNLLALTACCLLQAVSYLLFCWLQFSLVPDLSFNDYIVAVSDMPRAYPYNLLISIYFALSFKNRQTNGEFIVKRLIKNWRKPNAFNCACHESICPFWTQNPIVLCHLSVCKIPKSQRFRFLTRRLGLDGTLRRTHSGWPWWNEERDPWDQGQARVGDSLRFGYLWPSWSIRTFVCMRHLQERAGQR